VLEHPPATNLKRRAVEISIQDLKKSDPSDVPELEEKRRRKSRRCT
jgi:hypothetical protein